MLLQRETRIEPDHRLAQNTPNSCGVYHIWFPSNQIPVQLFLLWILGIRYGFCIGPLNSHRGEAARFQKLPTTFKRKYNTSEVIIPKMKRTDDYMFLPLAKKQYLRHEYSGTN